MIQFRKDIIILLLIALPQVMLAQSTGMPAWELYYDSAQMFWAKDWQKTIPLLTHAERSALNDLGIYDANYLTIVNDLGLAYAQLGDYKNAEKLFNKSLAIQAELDAEPNAAMLRTINNLARVQAEQGKFVRAKQLYKKVIGLPSSNVNQDAYLPAAKNLLHLYETEGQFDSALLLSESMRTRTYNDNGDALAAKYESDLARGRIDRRLRKYEASRIILEEVVGSLQHEEDKRLRPLFVQALQEIALLYFETGSFNKAEVYLLQGIQLLKDDQSAENAMRTELSNNLATVYERLGIYDKALEYYNKALTMCQLIQAPNSLPSLTLRSNIAGIHLKQDDLDLAIGAYEDIVTRLKNLVPESNPFYVTAINNLATAYRRNNQYKEASDRLQQAYELVQKYKLENEDLAATVMNNMAVLYTAQGAPEKAIPYYEKAYRLKRAIYGDQSILLMDLAGNMAVVYWALRKPELAIPLFQKSIGMAIRQIKYIFPNLSEAEQVQFYQKLKEDFERFNSVAFQASVSNPELLVQVFNNQITIKSLLFFTQQHRRDLINEKLDTALSQQYDLLKSKREQLGYFYQLPLNELATAEVTAADLEAQIDKLEKAISLKTRVTVTEKMSEQGIQWSDVQTSMQPNDALIELIRFRKYDLKTYVRENGDRVSFGFTDSIYYAALITTQETKRNPHLVLLKEGLNMETRFLSYYRNALTFDIPDDNSYTYYWKPFETAIVNKTKIYVSGDGVYHRINLNTLRQPKSGQYLIQHYDIYYLLNSAQVLEKEQKVFTSRKAVLIGDPVFDMEIAASEKNGTNKVFRFDPLPGTNTEITRIDKILKDNKWETRVYLKNLATEKNLKSIRSPDILHVATHGFFSTDHVKLNAEAKKDFLFYSGLVLSGANRNLENETAEVYDDGILTAYEVMNLDLTNTQLVVLSACETGLGKIENGEGVYGLQRSFLQAGARNILISLWKVDDQITQELMVSFYRYLFQGKLKREALKLAQLDLLKKADNPMGWGGFILVGFD